MIIQVEFWHWWVLALCFVVIEGMSPIGVYGAMALAGGILGGILMEYPYISISQQLGIFGTFTMVFTVIVTRIKRKQYLANLVDGGVEAEEMLGKEFELTSKIQNGVGEIMLDGELWHLKGPTIDSGVLVRVLKLDGTMLLVMPVSIINQHRAEQEEKN